MSNNNSFLHKMYKYQKLWYKWGCMILCSVFERDPSYRLRIIICMYLHEDKATWGWGWVNLATSILQAQVEVVQEETPPRTCEIDHSLSVRMHCSSNNNYNDNDEDYSKNHQQQTGLRTNSLYQLLLRLEKNPAILWMQNLIISEAKEKKNIQWYEQVINLLISPKGNKYYQNLVKSQVSYP